MIYLRFKHRLTHLPTICRQLYQQSVSKLFKTIEHRRPLNIIASKEESSKLSANVSAIVQQISQQSASNLYKTIGTHWSHSQPLPLHIYIIKSVSNLVANLSANVQQIGQNHWKALKTIENHCESIQAIRSVSN